MAARTGSSSISCAARRAADFGGTQALWRCGDLHGADKLGVLLFEIEDGDVRAESGEHVEQRGARGVEAERVEDERGAGKDGRGAEKERGRRDVAGDSGFDGVELLRAGDGDGVDGAREVGAEGAQGEFTVVAGADGFAHRCCAFGLQAGEQDAGLDLGAGHGRGVVDGAGAGCRGW